jgi:hypothetical protein
VHRAVLYGDDAEAVSVVVAQLAVALRRGDPAVVVLAPALRQAVEEALGSAAAEQVRFRDLADVHTGSVDTMIANYLRIVDELLGGGRMSTIVQYDHEHPHDGTQDFCFRVESAVNIAAARRPVDNTCLYDLRTASGSDIAAARQTHPLLVVGGVEGTNPDLGEAPPVPTFVVVRPQGLAGLRAWVAEHAPDPSADLVEDLVLVVNEAASAVVGTGAGTWVDLAGPSGRYTCRVRSTAQLPLVGDGALLDGLPVGHPLHELSLVARVTPRVAVRTVGTAQGSTFEISVPR